MPYTPPSTRSPASTSSSTPDASRRPSVHSGPRPSLPRSASYLSKHRRSPSSLSDVRSNAESLADATANALANASIRQSPPPVADDRAMPPGAIVSPPESASSGSDDEALEIRGRRLDNDKVRELKDAISQLSHQRGASPEHRPGVGDLMLSPQTLKEAIEMPRMSLSTTALADLKLDTGRANGHARSKTEPKVTLQKPDSSSAASEEDSDEELRIKPQMVRKKSGELVRPALRASSRRRPLSMPGTPTFSKAVHFDSHLEHVRHFLPIDRPLAVSAGSSPADNYDSDSEYPFPAEERPQARSPPYEYEAVTTNFPSETPVRRALPVRLEKVWLSPNDQRTLNGWIAVANLSFHKSVSCRFTMDYWKTTSEVAAEYTHPIVPKTSETGYDRFSFSIKLSDISNLEAKTLFFCIRYGVNGQEYWDNNNNANFQVDFRKKHLPQNGKNNFQGAASRPVGGLPRSNRRASPGTSAPRPKSMPVGFDEFGGEKIRLNFDQPIHEFLGESGTSGLRFKAKPTQSLASDNLSSGLSAPSGQAFANRYDFGASLRAVKDTHKDRKQEARRSPSGLSPATAATTAPTPSLPGASSDPTPLGANHQAGSGVPGTSSPNSSLPSSSYEELVNKYCFFGSKQNSPTLKDGTFRSGSLDGHFVADVAQGGGGSPRTAVPPRGSTAPPSSAPRRDPNPYFATYAATSPSKSPLQNLTTNYTTTGSASPGAASSSSSALRSASPASMVGSFQPFADSPGDFYAQHLHERFPFSSSEAHAATAIRG